ncbi:MAG TPA: formate/nitrite transporter family protein [Thermomicrobiaceae bacterium]|nr:formate/nitrite transporter family protein [Thermomicrobiaceae bacterium]
MTAANRPDETAGSPPASGDELPFRYVALLQPSRQQLAELRAREQLPASLVEHLQDLRVAPGMLRGDGWLYVRVNVPTRRAGERIFWERIDLILGAERLILIQPRPLTVVRRALARARRQARTPADLLAQVLSQVVESFHLLFWSIERELAGLEQAESGPAPATAELRAQVTELDRADDNLRGVLQNLLDSDALLADSPAANELRTALDRLTTIEDDTDRIEQQLDERKEQHGEAVAEARVLGAEAPEVFANATRAGERRLERLNLAHAMTALVGGLAVSFGAVAMVWVAGPWAASLGDARAHLLGALAFPIGFVILLIGKGELFTEDFFVPVTGVIRGRGRVRDLLTLWGYVLFFNFVGALIFAFLLSRSGVLEPAPRQFLIDLAVAKIHYSFEAAVMRGIFAGWLMTIMTWLILAADGFAARLVIIWMTGFLIVAGHFNHVVISMPEIFTAMFLGAPISIPQWLGRNFGPALLGNLIGGVVFVTLLGYAQARSMELSEEHQRQNGNGNGNKSGNENG